MDPEARRRLERHFRLSRTLVLAFTGSVLLYGVVGEVILRSRDAAGGAPLVADPAQLRLVLLALAATTVALGLWLPGRVLEASMARGQEPGPALQTALLLRCGLHEVPALLGLALVVLSGLRADCWILVGLSTLLHLLNLPRWEQWEERARLARR